MKTFLKKFLCCTLAALMLITMLAACGKDETSEETQIETSDTEAPKTNDPNTAVFTEAGLVSFDDYSISNVTYNSHNNPIKERIMGIYEIDGHTDITYDYNEDGYLIGITATCNWIDSDYGTAVEYFSVEYVVEDGQYKSATVKDSEKLTSAVEYHDNGTIKKLWIGESTEDIEWGFEQDEQGRRTLFNDGSKTLTLTYSQDSREATNGIFSWSIYDKNLEQKITKNANIQFEYSNGVIAKLTVNEENTESKEIFELSFSEKSEYLTKVVYYCYEGTTLDEQMSYDYSYTDFGLFKAIAWMYYENGVLEEGETFEYEYDSNKRLVKITCTDYEENNVKYVGSIITIDYDDAGRKVKSTEKWYDENGAEEDTLVETFEYGSNGKISKKTYLRTNADGTLDNHTVTTYEYDAEGNLTNRKDTRYDANGNVIS